MDGYFIFVGNTRDDDRIWRDARTSFDEVIGRIKVSPTLSYSDNGFRFWFDEESKNFQGELLRQGPRWHRFFCAEKGCRNHPLWQETVCKDHHCPQPPFPPAISHATGYEGTTGAASESFDGTPPRTTQYASQPVVATSSRVSSHPSDFSCADVFVYHGDVQSGDTSNLDDFVMDEHFEVQCEVVVASSDAQVEDSSSMLSTDETFSGLSETLPGSPHRLGNYSELSSTVGTDDPVENPSSLDFQTRSIPSIVVLSEEDLDSELEELL